MNVHKIVIPTPYAIGDVNAFLVKGDALTLFDVGPKTTEAYEALKWGIHSAGYEMSDIEQVVLTHHHPDHAGWVDAFPNAAVLGHEYVDHWMRKTNEFIVYRNEFYRSNLRLQAVPEEYIEQIVKVRGEMELFGTTPLTQFINDGDEIPGHPGLIAYYTPGHAQSHLIFVEENSRVAIGGDLLLDKVASNPLVEPPVDLSNVRPKSLLQYHHSLILLQNLQLRKIFAGHGNDIENINDLISLRLEKDDLRAKQVLSILSTPKTVLEVTKELYPSIYKKQLGLTLSKTIGHLDYLEKEEKVKKQLEGDIYVYYRL